MATGDDDDPLPEWALLGGKTIADAPVPAELPPDPVTAPHRTLGPELDKAYQSGRAGAYADAFKEGQEDALRALEDLFRDADGGLDETARHVVLKVREKLSPV